MRARAILRMLCVLALAGACAAPALATATPVGKLPPGRTSTLKIAPGRTFRIELRRPRAASGLVWRVARRYDSRVVRELGERDVGRKIVVTYRAGRRGKTEIVYAVTRGEASRKALASRTFRIVVR